MASATPRRTGRWLVPVGALLAGAPLATGCDLGQRSLAQPESRVVAEVYVLVDAFDTEVRAFLHRTVDAGDERSVEGARIVVRWDGDREEELVDMARESCLLTEATGAAVEPPPDDGTCYGLGPQPLESLNADDEMTVTVELPEGGTLTGRTTIPGDIELRVPPRGTDACYLPADTLLPLTWTRAGTAWAYTVETLVHDLPEALGEGVEVPSDPLFLLGLAISSSDTTLTFPGEVGVFDRFDLDRELTLALREGLPAGASATVTVAALDRNWVNWVRGGDFNPSGQIRVPSLHGRGTGVVAAVNRRTFLVDTRKPDLPNCLDASWRRR